MHVLNTYIWDPIVTSMDILTLCQSTPNISPKICEDLIKRALSAPGVYIFGEIYDAIRPKVDISDPSVVKWLQYLQIFIDGQLCDYTKLCRQRTQPGSLVPNGGELDSTQILKLKQLTLASLASTRRRLSFSEISKAIDIPVSDIKPFTIQAIYDGVVSGKIDSLNNQLIVDQALAREPSLSDLGNIHASLLCWQENIASHRDMAHSIATLSQDRAQSRDIQLTAILDSLLAKQ